MNSPVHGPSKLQRPQHHKQIDQHNPRSAEFPNVQTSPIPICESPEIHAEAGPKAPRLRLGVDAARNQHAYATEAHHRTDHTLVHGRVEVKQRAYELGVSRTGCLGIGAAMQVGSEVGAGEREARLGAEEEEGGQEVQGRAVDVDGDNEGGHGKRLDTRWEILLS